MSKSNNTFLAKLQRLGKALMTPVAVLPAAALLLRLGQPDIWHRIAPNALPKGIPWMAQAGNAVFENLPLIFAIGIAIGLSEENNGVSALAAAVGYFVLTRVALTFDETIYMGVLAGIIVGILAAYLYNKYKAIKVPDFLGFFGGKRFVPIITSFYSLIIGVICGYIWPYIQGVINTFGNAVSGSGSIGAFFFGFLNRLLLPFGLHHVVNSLFWFQFGTFTNPAGKVINGDLNRFFAGDPTAGTFMTGFFPIMMFALPAACFAMITAAKKENKKAVTGMLLGMAFTSFLTGVTEPIEFAFMFLAPVLYLIHALLTGISLALTASLGMKCGFGFSAGLIDYLLNFTISSNPVGLILVGLVFAGIYYVVFLFFIKKFNLPTPGRAEEEESARLTGLNNNELQIKAFEILEAIGGKNNIENIDACITRIRLTVKDNSKIDEVRLKEIGVAGVMKLNEKNYQIIVGTVADPLVTHIKALINT
ncbi:N-acetylglucosamine-specific PTS transporter subunit IIBC [Clostridium aestuarii]|uniref:N-acetylglucosamine-specific PTS transporter subunit IIBC n=1 Tax=Clostridium aestuarii TaxID=338193 RepID=A0ABT4D242_9CLOT|nr:N-acetylglucosamine-specific PTS transporter subunit IIBC [Clostridium aestuarii]MCY6485301.1 N-acetylglucosamine-specific PTS transporter subunit IIBC [Clostridium aestuarii]